MTSGVRPRRDPTYWTTRWEFSDSSTAKRIRMAADIIVLLLYLVKHWNASSSGRVSSIAMHPLAALMHKFPSELSIDRLFVRATSS